MGNLLGNKNATSTSGPSQQALSVYKGLANLLTTAASQPLKQYTGPRVAGFTPQQQAGFQAVSNAQGIGTPFTNAAAQFAGQGGQPIQSQQFGARGLAQFYNPYTQNVINTTMANINRNNQIQQNQLVGNAIASGASPFGGDRAGVAAAELARNQDLASNQTIAGLESQGFNTALSGFQTQNQQNIAAQQASAQAALAASGQLGSLGQQAQTQALQGASALLQTGGLQQQLAQEQLDIPYQNFLEARGYPQQQAGWLVGALTGVQPAGGLGTVNTQPGPSGLSQLAGAGLSIAGLGVPGGGSLGGNFLQGIGLKQGGIASYADGGTPEPPNDQGQSSATPPQDNFFNYAARPGYGIAIPQIAQAPMTPQGIAPQSYPTEVTGQYPSYLNALPEIGYNRWDWRNAPEGRRMSSWGQIQALMRAFPSLINPQAAPTVGVHGAKGGRMADGGEPDPQTQGITAPLGNIKTASVMGIGVPPDKTDNTAGPALKLPPVAGLSSDKTAEPDTGGVAPPGAGEPGIGKHKVMSANGPVALDSVPQMITTPKGTQGLKFADGETIDLGLPDPGRMGLQTAGAEMMAGTSPFAGVNIGKGLAAGIQAYQQAALNKAEMAVKLRPQFTKIGVDDLGQDIYGWVDPIRGTVTPASAMVPGGVGAQSGMQSSAAQTGNPGDLYSSLPKEYQNIVDELIAGRYPMQNPRMLQTPRWNKILAAANDRAIQLGDPQGFDAIIWQQRLGTNKDFTSGQTAKTITAGNTALQHLGMLDQTIDSLGNVSTNVPFAGGLINSVRNAAIKGSPAGAALNAFDAEKEKLAQEMTKFYRGTGGSEADVARDLAILDAAKSPEELHTAAKTMADFIMSKVNALQEQWHQGMGPGTPDMVLVKPEAQKALDSINARYNKMMGIGSEGGGDDGKPDGTIITNRQTGERRIKQGGKYVPIGASPEVAPSATPAPSAAPAVVTPPVPVSPSGTGDQLIVPKAIRKQPNNPMYANPPGVGNG